jgi:hypothetical protein
MAMNKYGETTCDGCSESFDGDPIDLIGVNDSLAAEVAFDQTKANEIAWFWLCGDCSEAYPNGAKDFFVSDYWVQTNLCVECGLDEVDELGHACAYCNESVDA